MFGIRSSIDAWYDALRPSRCLSRRWLGLERLDLRFTQPIATAMHFAPTRRPTARSLRHHPGSLVQYTGLQIG